MKPVDLRRVYQRLIRRTVAPSSRIAAGVRPPQTPKAALERLADSVAVKSVKLSQRRLRSDWSRLHPEIDRFGRKLLAELDKRQLPFIQVSGFRTRDEQAELFRRGVTRARPGQSPHNFGLAVDVVHFLRGWDLSHQEWATIGLIGKEVARKCKVKVEWGGDWSFYDPAHWQLADWRQRV